MLSLNEFTGIFKVRLVTLQVTTERFKIYCLCSIFLVLFSMLSLNEITGIFKVRLVHTASDYRKVK